MYRTASIAAYDVMDNIMVGAVVTTYEEIAGDAGTAIWRTSVQVRGTGEEDSSTWLKDALVALIETL